MRNVVPGGTVRATVGTAPPPPPSAPAACSDVDEAHAATPTKATASRVMRERRVDGLKLTNMIIIVEYRRPRTTPPHAERLVGRVEVVRYGGAWLAFAIRVGTAPRSASTSTPTRCSEEMTDDLLYHGDLNAAMRRMMQQGFRDREGRDVQRHARDAREAARAPPRAARPLRPRRRVRGHRQPARRDRRAGARRHRPPPSTRRGASGDKRREELLDDLAQQRRQELDQLPPDLAGRVSELQQYDWMDDAARQRFEELMEELQEAAPRLDVQPAPAGHVGDVTRAARSA